MFSCSKSFNLKISGPILATNPPSQKMTALPLDQNCEESHDRILQLKQLFARWTPPSKNTSPQKGWTPISLRVVWVSHTRMSGGPEKASDINRLKKQHHQFNFRPLLEFLWSPVFVPPQHLQTCLLAPKKHNSKFPPFLLLHIPFFFAEVTLGEGTERTFLHPTGSEPVLSPPGAKGRLELFL